MAIIIIGIGLIVLAAGIIIGIVAVVSWGIRQEERDFSMTRDARSKVSRGTRRVTDLYVRERSDVPGAIPRPDIYV
jgi:hypothetical protein